MISELRRIKYDTAKEVNKKSQNKRVVTLHNLSHYQQAKPYKNQEELIVSKNVSSVELLNQRVRMKQGSRLHEKLNKG